MGVSRLSLHLVIFFFFIAIELNRPDFRGLFFFRSDVAWQLLLLFLRMCMYKYKYIYVLRAGQTYTYIILQMRVNFFYLKRTHTLNEFYMNIYEH